MMIRGLVLAVLIVSAANGWSMITTPATSSSGNYTVSFSSVHANSTYTLYESTNGGATWSASYPLGSGRSKSFTNKPSGTYTYNVEYCTNTPAFGTNIRICLPTHTLLGWSYGVTRVTRTPPTPSTPSAITGPNSNYTGRYTLNWGASSGATSYQLQEKVNSGGWSTLQNTTSRSRTFSGKSNATYQYRVRACTSRCSSFTGTKSVRVLRTPGTPGTITGPASDTDGTYTLTWPAASGSVARYTLQRRLNSGSWSTISDTNSRTYNEFGRTNGSWRYRVRACNALSCSAYGSQQTVPVSFPPVRIETPPSAFVPVATRLTTVAERDNTDRAGSTAGTFRVNEGGGASYTIPIMTVPGTAGVAPEISLSYNSQGGNGLVGLGWSIDGLSSITRCRATKHQDTASKAVQWNNQDKFCLDGQRLLVSSGTYGSPNSTYKTEIDRFIKVTAKGGTAGNPEYWEVTDKDGSKRTFGDIADGGNESEVKNAAGKNLSWALKKFQDSVGNPMWFNYYNDSAGQRIRYIRYAYGSGRSLASQQAYLQFDYGDRSDDLTSYVAGTKFVNRKRLAKIYSRNRSAGTAHRLREYRVNYKSTSGVWDKTSKVASIQECANGKCLTPTTFTWASESPGFRASESGFINLSPRRGRGVFSYQPTDVNGDGQTDLVWLEWDQDGSDTDHHLKYALSDGEMLQNATFSNSLDAIEYGEDVSPSGAVKIRTLDYNGDGRGDVAVWRTRSQTWKVHLSTPQANGTWKLTTSVIDTGLASPKTQFTDLNGDGLVDAAYIEGLAVKARYLQHDTTQGVWSSRYYHFGSAQTLYTEPEYDWNGNDLGVTTYGTLEAGGFDFNGDGRSDLVIRFTHSLNFGQFLGGGGIYFPGNWGALVADANGRWGVYHNLASTSIYSPKKLKPVDINGDGLTDFIRSEPNGTNTDYFVELNTGAGFTTVNPNLTLATDTTDELDFIDYDGDKLLDFVWHDRAPGANRIKARLWDTNTNNFASRVHTVRGTDGNAERAHLFLDMNGDSHTDYVYLNNNKLFTYLSNNTGKFPDLITRMTNGLGAETDIAYETLANTAHYERLDLGRSTTTQEFCFNFLGASGCAPYTSRTVTPTDINNFYKRINDTWNLPSGSQTLGKVGPVLELSGPIPVVTRVNSSAPTSNANAKSAIEYFYAEAKIQASGRGLVGFEKLKTRDMQTGVQTTTTYRQDYPFIGVPIHTKVQSNAGHVLSESMTTYRLRGYASSWGNTARRSGTAALDSLHLYTYRVVDKSYALSANGASQGGLVSTTTTTNTYDAYGNATEVRVLTSGGGRRFETETDNLYGPSTADRVLGRLTRTTVNKRRDEQNNNSWELVNTRRSDFNYYGQSACPVSGNQYAGMLCQEIVEPSRSTLKTTTTHYYDSWGNLNKSRVVAGSITRCDVVTRKFDRYGRWPDEVFDCLGRKTSKVMSRDKYGAATSVREYTDVAATTYRVSTYAYTDRGVRYFEGSNVGTYKTTVAKQGSHAQCPDVTAMHTRERAAGGAETITCLDKVARPIRTVSPGFSDTDPWVYQDNEYDNIGRVKRATTPYFAGQTLCQPGSLSTYKRTRCWTTNTYDVLGRITQTVLPDDSDGRKTYTGLTVVEFNDTNKRRTEVRNVLGEVVSVTDDENGRVEYAYDAQGNLTSTKVKKPSGAGPTSITTTISYDRLGRKTSVDDPNKGHWTYQYNQLGELTQQTNDNGHYSRMTYDGLGRMKTRKDYYVGQGWESDTIWTYDNAPYTLGQLAHVRDLISGYVKLFSYDNLGRVSQTVTSLGVNFNLSLNGVDGDHYEKVTYDQHSRIFQVFDASRESATYTDNGVRYVYNNQGYLSAIQDAVVLNGTTREVYRLITAMDARGNVVNETLGNSVTRKHWFDGETNRIRGVHGTKFGAGDIQDLSYTWDTLGNLKQRRDRSGSKNLTENFTYDDLNRLKTSQVVGRSRKNVTYDSYGNIRSKTGIGTYSYSNARPNAVSAAGGVTYAYDDNGNNTSSSDGRVITYNTFDKVKSAAKGGHTTSFEYGPDRARYKRIDTKSGNTTTTLYIGNVEKITYPNNTRAIKRYIDGLVIKTLNYNSGRTLTSTDTHYTLSDHLGSVDVITSGSGVITQQLSYDAWGLRRNAVSWQELPASSIINFNTDLTRCGFTGHEHMDEVGIIHMNGRIYDPRLGRFLQADPFVDNAYNTQAFNRYSYLGNNPLNGTDPTGFFSFKQALAIVVVIVVTYLTYGAATKWALTATWGTATGGGLSVAGGIAAGAIAGAAGGFVSGLIATGSIQGGLHGAAFGALSGAIFGGLAAGFGEGISLVKVLSFGVGGGISNLLQGGKFGHGFVSAAISTLAGGASWLRNRGLAARAAINAVIGGTVSKVTGGKFANGAATAAFATVAEGVVSGSLDRTTRPLTAGEKAMAENTIYEGLNLESVRVCNCKWTEVQNANRMMVVGETIYAANGYVPDFSAGGNGQAFIHELGHIAQSQLGNVNLIIEGAKIHAMNPLNWFFRKRAYRYNVGKPFESYNIERQAQIGLHAYIRQSGRTGPATDTFGFDVPSMSELQRTVPSLRTHH